MFNQGDSLYSRMFPTVKIFPDNEKKCTGAIGIDMKMTIAC